MHAKSSGRRGVNARPCAWLYYGVGVVTRRSPLLGVALAAALVFGLIVTWDLALGVCLFVMVTFLDVVSQIQGPELDERGSRGAGPRRRRTPGPPCRSPSASACFASHSAASGRTTWTQCCSPSTRWTTRARHATGRAASRSGQAGCSSPTRGARGAGLRRVGGTGRRGLAKPFSGARLRASAQPRSSCTVRRLVTEVRRTPFSKRDAP
jgi:hypothetical protein